MTRRGIDGPIDPQPRELLLNGEQTKRTGKIVLSGADINTFALIGHLDF